ncbi:MAG: alkaline phosphatase, partial [Spirochaetota bacterium]
GTALSTVGVGAFLWRARTRASWRDWSADLTDAQVGAVLAGLFVSVIAGNVYFWGNLNILGDLADPNDGLIDTLGPYYHFDLLVPTAAFAAHVRMRTDYDSIAHDYLTGLRPDLIFGGGGYGMDPAPVAAAGYTVVGDAKALVRAAEAARPGDKIAGLFGHGHLPYLADGRPEAIPSLVEMARAAVDVLARDEEGFFLMIEAARIDHAGHSNDIARLIPEVLELDAVVEMLLAHPALQEDTLLVVTADHETGGLAVTSGAGQGSHPAVTWSTNGHTGVDVPLYATGPGADTLSDVVDNTMVRGAMMAALDAPDPEPALAGVAIPTSGAEE